MFKAYKVSFSSFLMVTRVFFKIDTGYHFNWLSFLVILHKELVV